MTIWGAEFDDEGYVDYIYYADNNYGDQDPVGAACIQQKISYRKDAVMNLPDQAYMAPIPEFQPWAWRISAATSGGRRPRRPARRLIPIELF